MTQKGLMRRKIKQPTNHVICYKRRNPLSSLSKDQCIPCDRVGVPTTPAIHINEIIA